MKKRQLIFLVVFLLVCLVIVISVIAGVTLDAAANKGKIVTVPDSTQTVVSDGTKWIYCGADSKFSETPGSGGGTTKRTKCGAQQGTDWAYCQTTKNIYDLGDNYGHTGVSCREECGKRGYLSWGMWSWDGRQEADCWCGDGVIFTQNPGPDGKTYGDPPNVACTFRGGTCRELKSCTTRSECIDHCDEADAYCSSDGVCVCDVSGNTDDSSDESSTPYLFSYVEGNYYIENDFMNTYFQTNGMTVLDTEQAYKNNDVGTVFSENEIYLIKQKPTVENGKIKLQIRELEPEESKIDQIKLIKVVHDKDTVAFASDTVYGSKSELRNSKLTGFEPISCVDNNGEDCLGSVLNENEDYLVKDRGDYIILKFKPEVGENYLYINSWVNEFVPKLIED